MVCKDSFLLADGNFSWPSGSNCYRESWRIRPWAFKWLRNHLLSLSLFLVDTPLSESRFSEYLQGWVDETREDDHHDEPHLSHDDDHEHEDEHGAHEPSTVPDDEPYPEEKDNSTPDDTNESEELNAEVNLNESEADEVNESQEPTDDNDSQEDQNDEVDEAEKQEVDDDDDDNETEEETRGDQTAETEEAQEASSNDNVEDVPNLFEDSAPFEEEVCVSILLSLLSFCAFYFIELKSFTTKTSPKNRELVLSQ